MLWNQIVWTELRERDSCKISVIIIFLTYWHLKLLNEMSVAYLNIMNQSDTSKVRGN